MNPYAILIAGVLTGIIIAVGVFVWAACTLPSVHEIISRAAQEIEDNEAQR